MGRWGDGEMGRIAYALFPVPHSLLPIAYCLFPIAHSLLPIAYCPFPIAHSLFPIPYSLFPKPPQYSQSRPKHPSVSVLPLHKRERGRFRG